MEIEKWKCPKCGGSHFGRTILTLDPVTFGDEKCHDEFEVGCKWRGKTLGKWEPKTKADDSKEPSNDRT